ncbi:hypothetical protein GE061_008915 [Apolygus lucorum]|uniref:RRM domain-containing protein n=1 Tax=Apolygus lucorum TaxID=248454 RepID=A0A6A4KGK7_APOLU|nr:hypothetical protein GE061_008915 [Apolygus lucorum]
MDETPVGQMTLKQLMEAMVSVLPTKEDFNTLKAEISQIKAENGVLREEVVSLRTMCRQNADTIEYLQNKAKECNLIFRGLPCSSDDPAAAVKTLVMETLDISGEIHIKKAFYIGQAKKIILAEFRSTDDKWAILKNTHKLRGTGLSVSQDYCPRTREKRAKLFMIKDELKKRKGEQIVAVVRNGTLLVNNTRFSWDLERGLECAGYQNAVTALNSISGENLGQFVGGLERTAHSTSENAEEHRRPRP